MPKISLGLIKNNFTNAFLIQGCVAQRITRLTTDQKIPGSNPGKLVHIFCAVQSLDLAFLAVIEQVQQIESVIIERQQKQE